jgi:hypothetical protein
MFRTFSTSRAQRLSVSLLCVLCSSILPVFAQDSAELKLAVHRDWGYGGGDQIQGLFTLEALGPETLASVIFKIDDQVIAEVKAAPFKFQIDTDQYPNGWHSLTVTGQTTDGRQLDSAARRFEFVPASVGFETAGRIMIPVGLGVGILLVVMFSIQFLPNMLGQRKTLPLGAPRRYGLKGGAVCPKCQRAFGIHFLSFNVGLQVFDYCAHCGKWSLLKPVSKADLAAAVQAELQFAQPMTPMTQESDEDKAKRQIEESRYVDEV